MQILDLIKTRRSVRSFKKDKNVTDDQIKMLLEAAIWSPSGGNMQPWKFFVVRDGDLKKELCEAAYNQEFILEAPAAISICIDKATARSKYRERGLDLYCIQDTAAAVQNILLTAHSLGLATCWVGAFDEEKAAKALDLHENLRPVAIIPVGYPAEKPVPPPRKDIGEVTEWI